MDWVRFLVVLLVGAMGLIAAAFALTGMGLLPANVAAAGCTALNGMMLVAAAVAARDRSGDGHLDNEHRNRHRHPGQQWRHRR